MKITPLDCCGIKEFSGLRDISDGSSALDKFFDLRYEYARTVFKGHPDGLGRALVWLVDGKMGAAYVIFTAPKSPLPHGLGNTYIEKALILKKYIEENDLGEVLELPNRVNPNSENVLVPYVWMLNGDNLIAYYQKLGKFDQDRYKDDFRWK